MSTYQLEITQIVDYPRYRVSRKFIKRLMRDRHIRTFGGSGLFYYLILCAHANQNDCFLLGDGMFVFKSRVQTWFRVYAHQEVIRILDNLEKLKLITYDHYGQFFKFNFSADEMAGSSCLGNNQRKESSDYFFLPMSVANELISTGPYSDADILLDLWLHSAYNDQRIESSTASPIAYIKNDTNSLLLTYSFLSARWGISEDEIKKIITIYEDLDYIYTTHFPEHNGIAIYQKEHFAKAFQESAMTIDRAEIPMSQQTGIFLSDDEPNSRKISFVKDRIFIPKDVSEMAKPQHLEAIIKKVLSYLSSQEISCHKCSQAYFELSLLPTLPKIVQLLPRSNSLTEYKLMLKVCCGHKTLFVFNLELSKEGS